MGWLTPVRGVGQHVWSRAQRSHRFRMALANTLPVLAPGLARAWCAKAGLAEAIVGRSFDRAHYARQAQASFRDDDHALLHYLMIGSDAGIHPSSSFDPRYYRQSNHDVVVDGYEPFVHFCLFGQAEGRAGQLDLEVQAGEGSTPDVHEMLKHPRVYGDGATMDVVIPVYGSRSLTLNAIDSVLAAPRREACEIVVVDDASPDPELQDDLKQLARKGLITLVVNESNRGFAASVNRGIALHPQRDVVLLNSDTQVFGDWLGRLAGALHSAPSIGTATPFSNAATILSYPVWLRDNQVPLEIGYPALDKLCAAISAPPMELPTGVGFCMAIKRACLKEVGPFDAVRFGKGYGEENDFCLRASAAGWTNVAATNVFVWHRGGASFGRERAARLEAAQATIEALHPGYHAKVHDFIRRDPGKNVRMALDAARVAAAPSRKILHLCPQDQTIEVRPHELILQLAPDYGSHHGRWRLIARDFGPLPNLPRLDADTGQPSVAKLLSMLAIDEIRTYAPPQIEIGSLLVKAANEAGIPVR